MKVSVLTFRARNGLGVQSVTGVVDRFGIVFVPEHIFMVNSSSLLETLYSDSSGVFTAASINTNSYHAADGKTSYFGIGNASLFANKVSSEGGGTGVNAFLNSLKAQAAFGGAVYRQAKVVSVYAGGFDLQIMVESFTRNTDVMVIVFGSDASDLKMEFLGSGTIVPTTFAAKGLINFKAFAPLTTGAVNTSAGGPHGYGWGWDSPTGGPMSTHAFLTGIDKGDSYTYQSHISYDNSISALFAKENNALITVWNPTDVHVGGTINAAHKGYIIGGTGVITATGSFIQQAGLGHQTVNAGVHALALFMMSIGKAPNTEVVTDVEYCFGWTNGAYENSCWMGETAPNVPLNGACFISQHSILRFASAGAAGGSTVFTSIANMVECNRDGTFTINWTVNDGIGREILYFAIGATPNTLPPTPVDLHSGIFFLDPTAARRDNYYNNTVKKIPNPTIESALLGE